MAKLTADERHQHARTFLETYLGDSAHHAAITGNAKTALAPAQQSALVAHALSTINTRTVNRLLGQTIKNGQYNKVTKSFLQSVTPAMQREWLKQQLGGTLEASLPAGMENTWEAQMGDSLEASLPADHTDFEAQEPAATNDLAEQLGGTLEASLPADHTDFKAPEQTAQEKLAAQLGGSLEPAVPADLQAIEAEAAENALTKQLAQGLDQELTEFVDELNAETAAAKTAEANAEAQASQGPVMNQDQLDADVAAELAALYPDTPVPEGVPTPNTDDASQTMAAESDMDEPLPEGHMTGFFGRLSMEEAEKLANAQLDAGEAMSMANPNAWQLLEHTHPHAFQNPEFHAELAPLARAANMPLQQWIDENHATEEGSKAIADAYKKHSLLLQDASNPDEGFTSWRMVQKFNPYNPFESTLAPNAEARLIFTDKNNIEYRYNGTKMAAKLKPDQNFTINTASNIMRGFIDLKRNPPLDGSKQELSFTISSQGVSFSPAVRAKNRDMMILCALNHCQSKNEPGSFNIIPDIKVKGSMGKVKTMDTIDLTQLSAEAIVNFEQNFPGVSVSQLVGMYNNRRDFGVSVEEDLTSKAAAPAPEMAVEEELITAPPIPAGALRGEAGPSPRSEALLAAAAGHTAPNAAPIIDISGLRTDKDKQGQAPVVTVKPSDRPQRPRMH